MSEFNILLVIAFGYVLWKLDRIGRQIEAVSAEHQEWRLQSFSGMKSGPVRRFVSGRKINSKPLKTRDRC